MRNWLLTLGLVALAAPAFADGPPFNFKVSTTVEKASEGPDRARSFVTIGSKRVAFAAPFKCQLGSEPDQLTVYLSNRGIFGQITVTNSPFRPEQAFDTEIESYRQTAEATLPLQMENMEFKGANQTLYQVNDWKSLAFEWVYSSQAHRTHRQVTYLNYDAQHQLCLTIVCDEAGWEAAQAIATRFMHSWYPMD